MIEGIGIDVVEVRRLERAIDKWGDAFIRKVFTDGEIAYAKSRKNFAQHMAARFAVKEAVAKALTTGWSGGFRWKDVEVANDPSGKPSVTLHGHVQKMLEGSKVMVSISHSESVVVAFAVIESLK